MAVDRGMRGPGRQHLPPTGSRCRRDRAHSGPGPVSGSVGRCAAPGTGTGALVTAALPGGTQ